jgi:ornithine decarboxylase
MTPFALAASPRPPIALQPYGLPTYRSAHDAVTDLAADDAIFALYPRRIARAAQTFLTGFPGTVLYAVKANPHPALMRVLYDEGVRHFDVASIREIDLVADLCPDARMFLMHPIKSRATIQQAYARGVRDFSFDHADELQKIWDCTHGATDLNLYLRLALPQGNKTGSGAVMPLSGKFGASAQEAVAMLRAARPHAQRLGLCFHVGSHCIDLSSYDCAISYARKVVDAAGVEIDMLDVGGGFPVAYPGMTTPPLTDYFSAIRDSVITHGFGGIELLGEPGRALCAEGGSTLVRVELRKGTDLYINDGTYGSLFDAGQFAWKFPVCLLRNGPPEPASNTVGFRFFGPTCDSSDTMIGPFHLPADTGEGDWIEVQHLGAYGQALTTRFNGFYSDHTVAILED